MKGSRLRPQRCVKCRHRLADFDPRVVRAGPKDRRIAAIKCPKCGHENAFHLLNQAA